MNINIRQEKPADYEAVFKLIEKAFEKVEMSDHKEQLLVQRLRNSTSFVPELSLIAEDENKKGEGRYLANTFFLAFI